MPLFLLDLRVWLAAALAGALLGVYVQTTRLSGCQAELRGAKAQMDVLGRQLKAQNEAVADLEAKGKERAQESARALEAARRQTAGGVAQAQALERALAAAKGQHGACPAGAAVQEVRRALAPR